MGLLGAQERVEARKNDTWIDGEGQQQNENPKFDGGPGRGDPLRPSLRLPPRRERQRKQVSNEMRGKTHPRLAGFGFINSGGYATLTTNVSFGVAVDYPPPIITKKFEAL